MDECEGVPREYSRREILVDGFDPPVEAYFFNGEVAGLKDCGGQWPR
jgi:hypothetical protein